MPVKTSDTLPINSYKIPIQVDLHSKRAHLDTSGVMLVIGARDGLQFCRLQNS